MSWTGLKQKGRQLWSKRWPLVLAFVATLLVSLFYHFHNRESWSAILHVALPAMVLFMELYMLRAMTKESAERDKQVEEFKEIHKNEKDARERVLDDLNRFRISISREHYRQELLRTLRNAQESIIFTGVTLQASSREKAQAELISVIRDKEEAAPGKLLQRGIIAERIEALAGALELVQKTNTEIKFRKLHIVTRLRFQVCDRTVSVLGVAEGDPTLAEVRPTERAFTINSAMLGDALTQRFEEEWKDPESKCVWKYLDEFIKDLQGETPADRTILTKARVLQLLEAAQNGLEVEFINKHCPRFASLA